MPGAGRAWHRRLGNRVDQEARGRRPRTRQEALPPGPPSKGEALCNLSIGKVREGGPTATLRGPGWPSLTHLPKLIGPKGPRPLAEFQEAEPLGGVRGEASAFLVQAIAQGRNLADLDSRSIPG